MKIRNPRLISLCARLIAFLVRCWMVTQRFAYQNLGPDLEPQRVGPGQRYIYAFWHENMLMPLFCYRNLGIHVLVSASADGELIAQTLHHLGYALVRGSSTRGGAEALRQMRQISEESHLVFTPDGPRGPRRELQMGLIYLAARTGLPVVPVGIGYQKPWRFGSWDRFALPWPWGRTRCVTAEPILVPARADRAAMERYREQVETTLAEVSELAETWAEGGPRPTSQALRKSA
jgi:lysophospholipid acyltransferase (LPLAT)-like uncharacterized protein